MMPGIGHSSYEPGYWPWLFQNIRYQLCHTWLLHSTMIFLWLPFLCAHLGCELGIHPSYCSPQNPEDIPMIVLWLSGTRLSTLTLTKKCRFTLHRKKQDMNVSRRGQSILPLARCPCVKMSWLDVVKDIKLCMPKSIQKMGHKTDVCRRTK